jgi:hypothetical protein
LKRLIVVASLIASLAVPSLAFAGAAPTGSYSTKITTPKGFKGTWVMAFAKGETYTIKLNGKVVVHGHDLSIGSQIQFQGETGPAACPTPGFYTFKKSGKKLTFSKIHDSAKCSGRSFVLGHPFTAVQVS